MGNKTAACAVGTAKNEDTGNIVVTVAFPKEMFHEDEKGRHCSFVSIESARALANEILKAANEAEEEIRHE